MILLLQMEKTFSVNMLLSPFGLQRQNSSGAENLEVQILAKPGNSA